MAGLSSKTSRQILVVDDEQAVLDGIVRRLGGDFEITAINSPRRALECIAGGQEFAVVLTDMQMPLIDGMAFIEQARTHSPQTVFLMLTGNQDLPTATRALNDGQVFRYFTKPCSSSDLRAGLEAALKQYALLTAEKELLQRTFVGAVNIMTDIMGYAQPRLISINEEFQYLVKNCFGKHTNPEAWDYLIAAKLSLVGFVQVPHARLEAFLDEGQVSDADLVLYRNSLEVSERLVARIPRLERIAELIRGMRVSDGSLEGKPWHDTGSSTADAGTVLGSALAFVIGRRRYGSGLGKLFVQHLYSQPDEQLLKVFIEKGSYPIGTAVPDGDLLSNELGLFEPITT
ncbi:MAG: response regulator [Pirellulales bacterium]